MTQYFAVSFFILLIILVIVRVQLLKKRGIKAVSFGERDKTDYLIPPFALFYFYLVLAHAFNLPTFATHVLLRSEFLQWIGVACCFSGLLLLLWSMISFKDSFRVGIEDNTTQGLVTTGVFAYSRNPIYVAFCLVLLGQFLVFSNWILLVYIPAAVWLIHRQILREEAFLKECYGEAYREYCKQVRRYL